MHFLLAVQGIRTNVGPSFLSDQPASVVVGTSGTPFCVVARLVATIEREPDASGQRK